MNNSNNQSCSVVVIVEREEDAQRFNSFKAIIELFIMQYAQLADSFLWLQKDERKIVIYDKNLAFSIEKYVARHRRICGLAVTIMWNMTKRSIKLIVNFIGEIREIAMVLAADCSLKLYAIKCKWSINNLSL